jgi:Carboxypeptidase regulatory-like domain
MYTDATVWTRPSSRCLGWVVAMVCLSGSRAQTTQGVIQGRVTEQQTGRPLPSASVTCFRLDTNTPVKVLTDSYGNYAAPLLPPGIYRVRAESPGYQPQEVQQQELRVASTLEVEFEMRLAADVFGTEANRIWVLPGGLILHFFGPDVKTREVSQLNLVENPPAAQQSTLSYVVEPRAIDELPLAGRDVYTTLVIEPFVTSDAATSRGLGLSINGQRPSASNFLLDGIEWNNSLVSGPLGVVPPEAVQEYRVSTNNFSAEYGRTNGYLANAVTRSGGDRWHGLFYEYLQNDVLNANDFQRNLIGLDRVPLKESESGFTVGGPVLRGRLFASLSADYLRFRSYDAPVNYRLPTSAILESTTSDAPARLLLTRFAHPAVTDPAGGLTAMVSLAPPSSLNQFTALPRLDYVTRNGVHRFFARVAASSSNQPDFSWTPYTDFVTPLRENASAVAVGATSILRPNLTNEARAGWSASELRFDRRWPEIPVLASGDGATLPGSPLGYSFRNRSHSLEVVDNLVWTHGRHIAKFGGGFLGRRLDGYLTEDRDSNYVFTSALAFALSLPDSVQFSVRAANPGNLVPPDFNRAYRYNQFSFFGEDVFRVTLRLTLNYGVRYESPGAPYNVGPAKDALVQLGGGNTFPQRIQTATLVFPSGGNEQLYDADYNDVAGRVGFAYALSASGHSSLRGAIGTFYDRPFDNLWQNLANNNVTLAYVRFPFGSQTDFLQPQSELRSSLRGIPYSPFSELTMYQPGIRTGYTESYFLSLQHQFSDQFGIEVDGAGALGRKLITTDVVSRPTAEGYNPLLPRIAYRANQGTSDYRAVAIVARYRGRTLNFQTAYTFGRSVDNQSDPLIGRAFNLEFTRVAGAETSGVAAFTHQFDSSGDRADSNFDQTHNLVFYAIWAPPAWKDRGWLAALSRGWQIATLGAIRSGLPYTVSAPIPAGSEAILNNRAELIDPAHALQDASATGGKLLLNSAAFSEPDAGQVGNTARNAFRGPGLASADLSLSRSFPLPWLGESARVTFRADAYNVLNHANLNNPDALVGSPTFGLATYGRKGTDTGFPGVSPFVEKARQIQLLLRVNF